MKTEFSRGFSRGTTSREKGFFSRNSSLVTSLEVFQVPFPFKNHIFLEKQLSSDAVVVKCDTLYKSFVLKRLLGVKQHLQQFYKQPNMVPDEHLVQAYDPIPLRDDVVLQVTEYHEKSKNVLEAIKDFKLQDLNTEIPTNYIRFLLEYVLQMSLALYQCHSSRDGEGLYHGNLGLTQVLVTKNKEQKDFKYIFKLNNFQPWQMDTFPLSNADHQLISLLQLKKQQLVKSDVLEAMRIKDMYLLGLSILDIMQGAATQQSKTNFEQFSPESMPAQWNHIEEAVGIIEIISLCFQLEIKPSPLEKLKKIINISSRYYQVYINSSYQLPKHLFTDTKDAFSIAQKLKLSESFCDRGVLMQLRGEAEIALEYQHQALKLNEKNVEAYLNSLFIQWTGGNLTDQEVQEKVEKEMPKLFDQATADLIRILISQSAGMIPQSTDLEKLSEISFKNRCLTKILNSLKDHTEKEGSPEDKNFTNCLVKQEDHVHHVVLSNNERYMATITCDKVYIYNVQQDAKLLYTFDLPQTMYEESLEDDSSQKNHSSSPDAAHEYQDDLDHSPVLDRLEFDDQGERIDGEDQTLRKKDKVFYKSSSDKIKTEDQNAESPGHLNESVAEPKPKKNQSLTKLITAAINDSGNRVVMQCIDKFNSSRELSNDALFIYDAAKEEGTETMQIKGRRITIPMDIANEEIISLDFIGDGSYLVEVKTKNLKTYLLKLNIQSLEVLSSHVTSLETRSIFGQPEDYILHFEALKTFIDSQEKQGSIIWLPKNNTQFIAGYSTNAKVFFVYDILLQKVTRQFSIKNPDFIRRPQSSSTSKLLKEEELKSKKKVKKRSQLRSHLQEEEVEAKPYLELDAHKDIRSSAISSKGTYIVFNTGNYIYVATIAIPQTLFSSIQPLFMHEKTQIKPKLEGKQLNEQQGIDEQRRQQIKKKVEHNPQYLISRINTMYDALLESNKNIEYVNCENTFEMSMYIDEAINFPQLLNKNKDILIKIREFQYLQLPPSDEYVRRSSIEGFPLHLQFDQVQFQKPSDKITCAIFSSIPSNFYACVAFGRNIHFYDFHQKKLLFKLSVASVKAMHFLDRERILVVREEGLGNGCIRLYSIPAYIASYQRLEAQKAIAFTKKEKVQKRQTTLLNSMKTLSSPTGGQALNQTGVAGFEDNEDISRGNSNQYQNDKGGKHDQRGGLKLNMTRFDEDDEDQINHCKVINFDEKIVSVITSRSNSEFGYIIILGTTKFSVYYAYVDDEVEVDDDLDDDNLGSNDDSKFSLQCDKKWDSTFSTLIHGLGRVTCVDLEDSCERVLSGSTNGSLGFWDVKFTKFIKVFGKEDNSIDHIRSLSRSGDSCLVLTAKPDLSIYEITSGTKKQITLPRGLGHFQKIIVDKSETAMIGIFSDKTIGIFNLLTCQFVKKINDYDFSKCFIDDYCTYIAVPDPRARAFDFRWLKWENDMVRLERPVPKVEAPPINTGINDDEKNKKNQKSSLCQIF